MIYILYFCALEDSPCTVSLHIKALKSIAFKKKCLALFNPVFLKLIWS